MKYVSLDEFIHLVTTLLKEDHKGTDTPTRGVFHYTNWKYIRSPLRERNGFNAWEIVVQQVLSPLSCPEVFRDGDPVTLSDEGQEKLIRLLNYDTNLHRGEAWYWGFEALKQHGDWEDLCSGYFATSTSDFYWTDKMIKTCEAGLAIWLYE